MRGGRGRREGGGEGRGGEGIERDGVQGKEDGVGGKEGEERVEGWAEGGEEGYAMRDVYYK